MSSAAAIHAGSRMRSDRAASSRLATGAQRVPDEVDGDDDPGEEEGEDAPGGRVAAAVPLSVPVDEQRQGRVERDREDEGRWTGRGRGEH